MELRHLRYFIAVAEELHFGRAAARLQMAQPPLSQQIRQLEGELGVALFHRSRRHVALTEAGAAFLDGARRTLAEVDRAARSARRAARGETGHLAIGFVGTATYEVLPALLRSLRDTYPEITLSLQEMTTAQQVTALTAGEIDLGLLRPPVHEPALSLKAVRREELVAVVPVGHRLARLQQPLDLKALAEEPFVLFPPAFGQGLYGQILDGCRQAGFTPRVVQEAVQMETLLSLVAGAVGVTLAPASVLALGRPGVVCLPLDRSPVLHLAAAWRTGEQRAVLQRALALMPSCWQD
ncbi:MAG: LysR substrate-binding domain-containing protein [Bacillota bacterium]